MKNIGFINWTRNQSKMNDKLFFNIINRSKKLC